MTAPTTTGPPAGTYNQTTDSQGNAELVPSVDPTKLTAVQAQQIATWLATVNPSVNWNQLTTNLQQTAQGLTITNAQFLINSYAQALQNNKLDVGGATPGLDIPNPLTELLDILTNGKLWTRVAEFTVGGLMLGIALYGIVKGTTGANSAPTKVLRKANPIGLGKAVVSSQKRHTRENAAANRASNATASREANRVASNQSREVNRAAAHSYRESARENVHQRRLEQIHARGQYVKPKPANNTQVDIGAPVL